MICIQANDSSFVPSKGGCAGACRNESPPNCEAERAERGASVKFSEHLGTAGEAQAPRAPRSTRASLF